MERPTFKITGDFSENTCFENRRYTSDLMKFRRFAVFLMRLVTKIIFKSKLIKLLIKQISGVEN